MNEEEGRREDNSTIAIGRKEKKKEERR